MADWVEVDLRRWDGVVLAVRDLERECVKGKTITEEHEKESWRITEVMMRIE